MCVGYCIGGWCSIPPGAGSTTVPIRRLFGQIQFGCCVERVFGGSLLMRGVLVFVFPEDGLELAHSDALRRHLEHFGKTSLTLGICIPRFRPWCERRDREVPILFGTLLYGDHVFVNGWGQRYFYISICPTHRLL
uniref:Uncharacterized protein n=1 Tax=Cacopsylla melanoneura TaxID=428564 RepID=A0A8D8RTT3_9HEMI